MFAMEVPILVSVASILCFTVGMTFERIIVLLCQSDYIVVNFI